MIKKDFQVYFEGIEYIYPDTPIDIKTNYYIPMTDLFALASVDSLEGHSKEYIMNLFTFEEGVQVLLHCKYELAQMDLMMYLFSSPFVSDKVLLELLDDEKIIKYANDNWIEHLYANPNIREISIYDLEDLSL